MPKYKSLSLIHQAHDHLLAQWRPNINFIILICAVRSGETRSVKNTLITVALINYTNKQQDFSAFITFSSQGSSCPSPTHLCFFSGKIPSNVAARLTRKYWVPNFRHFVTIPPPPLHPYLPLFVTIQVTIRDYSSLFATIRTIRTIRDYSLFGIRDCSLFGFSRYPNGSHCRKEVDMNALLW